MYDSSNRNGETVHETASPFIESGVLTSLVFAQTKGTILDTHHERKGDACPWRYRERNCICWI